MHNIIFNITCFLFIIAFNNPEGQIEPGSEYERYSVSKRKTPYFQQYERILFISDSLVSMKKWIGNIEDNKNNYPNWQLTEEIYTWKYNGERSLIMRRGNTQSRYLIRKRELVYATFQLNSNNNYVIRYNLVPFDNRVKYKLVNE